MKSPWITACFLLLTSSLRAQDGGLDTGFDPAANDIVQAVALQTVGGEQKILVGGWFSNIGGGPHSYLARLNANGTKDTSFTGTANGIVTVLSMCADGDILVAGNFTQIGGGAHTQIARLAPNGAHRSTFNVTVLDGSPGEVNAIRELPNGQIVIAGYFTNVTGSNALMFNRTGIALLNADGSVDPAFDAQVSSGSFVHISSLDVLPGDGSLVIAGRFTHFNGVPRPNFARLNAATGALITSFNANFSTNDDWWFVHCRANGNIVIGGGFTATFGGTGRNKLAEVDATGALTSWNPSINSQVDSLASQANGKLLVGGRFHLANGQTRRGIARFNTDGTLDDSFAPLFSLYASVFAIAVQADGGIVAGGEFTHVTVGATTEPRNFIARIHGTAPPSLPEIELRKWSDNSLVTLGQIFDLGSVAAGNGPGAWATLKIVNTGSGALNLLPSTGITGVNASDFSLVGTLPATLPPNGGTVMLTVSLAPTAVGTRSAALHIITDDADESDLYVNLTGAGYDPANGQKLDDAFNANVQGGIVYDMAVLPDGKIIIVGSFTSVGGLPRNHIARLNADGTVDDTTSWHTPGTNGPIEAVAVQSDGKIIIGGQFTQASYYSGLYSYYLPSLARLHSNGDLDLSWYPSTDGAVQTLLIEPTNILVVGGDFGTVNGVAIPNLARIDLQDTGYVYPGFVPSPNGNVRKVLRDSSGRILVAGTFTSIAGATMNGVARLLNTGAIDPGWSNPQCDNHVNTIAIQPSDGKILIGGQFEHVSGQSAYHLARLNVNGSLDSFLAHCNGTVHDIAIAADGKIVVGGSFDLIWSPGFQQWTPQARIARFHGSDGYPDFGFPVQAYADRVRTVDFQPDGALIFGGAFTQVNLSLRNNLARIAPESPDIHVLSTGDITHTDGDTRDFGTKLVGEGYNTVIFTLQNVGLAPLTGFSGLGGITIDGTNAAAFSLSAPGATSLATGGTVAFFIYFNPQGPGAHEAWLHIHSNDPDEEPFDIKLVGTGGVPITDWRQQNFGTTANTGNAADDADPDGDGISNLMEFATAGTPNTNNTAPTSITPPSGSFIEFFYTRNKLAMAQLSYDVQWTDDLLTAWVNTGVTETILSDSGTVQQVKALVPKGTTDHRFVRLKVTR